MIIYVSDNSNCKLLGKMNFVDLAGYVDARRTSTDGSTLTESTGINKSLHAVLNVIKGLNTNESHVSYRESKLTRMLKESLGGRNHVLMLTCLNPLFCQDTIHSISLASRSCQSTNHLLTDSTMKDTNSARLQLISSQKTVKPATTPRVVKKQIAYGVQLSTKKGTAMSNRRKLFDSGKKVIADQAKSPKDDDSVRMLALLPESDTAMTPFRLKEALWSKPVLESALALVPNNKVVFEDKSLVGYSLVEAHEEVDISAGNKSKNMGVTPLVTCDKSLLEHDDGTGKKDKSLPKNKGGSPPLSERLREISNNLKLFCSASPRHVMVPDEVDKQHGVRYGFADVIEPKTPTAENCTRFSEKMKIKYSSPWEIFNQRSSGMKNTLVEDYLKFLNTASKGELKRLKGIGEKRATYILKLREASTEPFKSLEDVEDIGLSAKQIKGMMKNVVGELFS